MGSLMDVDDWALPFSWSLPSDHWQHSADQFFEPLQLLHGKSDEAEYQLFNDDVTLQNQSISPAWSDGSSCMCCLYAVEVT